jgi:hypothetical protein
MNKKLENNDMNKEVRNLEEFVTSVNTQWQQYLGTIKMLENLKKTQIELAQKKIGQILQRQLNDNERQLSELDEIQRIFIAQNQSVQTISKIRKTIENFRDILSKSNRRDIEDIENDIENKINAEIDKAKTIEQKWVKAQSVKFDEIKNEILSHFKDYDNSILTNNLEEVTIDKLNFDGLYPLTDELKISDKSYTYKLLGAEQKMQIPQLIHFVLKNSITVSYRSGINIRSKIHELILRILLSAEAGNIKFLFIDSRNNGENFKEFLSLNPDLYCNSIVSRDMEIESRLLELEKHMTFISQDKLVKYGDIIEYNRDNPKDSYPLYFIFFDNYPYGISAGSAKTMDKLLRIGPKTGIHTIFFTNENNFNNDSYNLLAHTQRYVLDENDIITSSSLLNKLCSSAIQLCDHRYNPDKNLLFNDYIPEQNEMWKADSTASLDIPIGLELSKPVSLVYNNILKTHAHIVGQTGSGKSSLLHSIIMSACYKYSPKELELWLLDFKHGNEFQIYVREALPHAKVITLKNEKEMALHVLNLAEKEIKKRGALFTESNVNDYAKYRKQFPDKELPRILIAVDEYQLLYNEDAIKFAASKSVTELLEKGRSFGISILFASQTVHIPDDSLGNISTRIVLRTDMGRQLLDSGSSKTLKLTIGQGVFNSANGSIDSDVLFRWFYLPDDEQKSLIRKMADKAAKENYLSKMQVFDSETKADLQRVQLLKHYNPESLDVLTFVPGEKVLIDDSDFTCKFSKQPNNNLLVVSGVSIDPSVRALYGPFISMLPQLKANNAKIFLMNFIKKNNKIQYEMITAMISLLKDNDFDINCIEDDSETSDMLDEIQEYIENSKDTDKPETGCLVIFNMENAESFEYDEDLEAYSDTCQKLKAILDTGSKTGFFTLLQCTSCDGFFKHFVNKDLGSFDHRIALQMSYENSRDFVDNPHSASTLDNLEIGDAAINRSSYYNSHLQKYMKLKTFEFLNDEKLKEIVITNINS